MRTKRALATILWFLTGWMVGAMVAYAVGLTWWLAPILAALAATAIVADPYGVFVQRRSAALDKSAASAQGEHAVSS